MIGQAQLWCEAPLPQTNPEEPLTQSEKVDFSLNGKTCEKMIGKENQKEDHILWDFK